MPDRVTEPAAPPAAPDHPTASEGPRAIDSDALLRGANEVVIRHAGRNYRLRRTRLGKLILTA